MFGLRSILNALWLFCICSVFATSLQRRDCKFTWPAYDGDTCSSLAEPWGITEAQFISYNPGVGCSSLVVGKEYCVEWAGALPSPSPTPRPTTLQTSSSTKLVLHPATYTAWFPAITPKPSPTPTPGPTKPAPTQPNVDAKCKQSLMCTLPMRSDLVLHRQ
jgi:hypothetical protein